nr:PREDICTED: zinc finger MYM-type protein 1-like [Latimeria chalumnae]|eukprot:XP_006009390.1 PREDICTED: zinc finger MYM-type protein 1-like [Latimeria chalumnae]
MHENSECHRRAMLSVDWHFVVIFGSPHNGNFLGIVELIVKYDAFLAQHINKHGNMGCGHASYLSSTICEEFIALLGEKVFEHIVKELKEAKYFSVLVDSTPDISNLDQLMCVVRYVLPNGPVERFLTFLDFETHSGQDIAKSLLQFFEKIGVNIVDCRGQSYDNASNLSGKYQGMQAWIRERSENAVYIPCCAHSLNLVGQCAVDCCFTAISFFKNFVFFAASTKRWKVLLERLAEANEKLPVVKNLSETLWSAHADAATALQKGYDRIKAALDHLSRDHSQKPDNQIEAQGLTKTTEKLEISIMTEIWHMILEWFHKTSAKLQDPKMDLNTANEVRIANHVLITTEVSYIEDENATDNMMMVNQKKPSCRYVKVLELKHTWSLWINLHQLRFSDLDAYKEVYSRFGFLSKLTSMSVGEIRDAGKKLLQYYSTELEDCITEELVHFSEFVKTEFARKSSGDGPEIQMYCLLGMICAWMTKCKNSLVVEFINNCNFNKEDKGKLEKKATVIEMKEDKNVNKNFCSVLIHETL